MKIYDAEKIINTVDKAIEKSCDTCNDQPICIINGNTDNVPCKHWKPDIALFQKEWDKVVNSNMHK